MAPYVIITPAHNEEALIERTIQSMIAQSLWPLKWIIVSDGSTDQTGDIVHRYASQYRFITLIDVERTKGRNFANKVTAFNRGLDEAGEIGYHYIGNLDADIVLEPCYFEGILSEFQKDAMLGIAGGIVFTNIDGSFATYDTTLDSVGGAVQLFRRACFEAIGGYTALEWGGIDAAAEIKARMFGWKVRKFPEHKVLEYRRTGSAQAKPLIRSVREGRKFYSLGYGLLFYLVRCVYRAKDPPYVTGSIAALYGFMESLVRRRPRVLPQDVIHYLRNEQNHRLKGLFGRMLRLTQ